MFLNSVLNKKWILKSFIHHTMKKNKHCSIEQNKDGEPYIQVNLSNEESLNVGNIISKCVYCNNKHVGHVNIRIGENDETMELLPATNDHECSEIEKTNINYVLEDDIKRRIAIIKNLNSNNFTKLLKRCDTIKRRKCLSPKTQATVFYLTKDVMPLENYGELVVKACLTKLDRLDLQRKLSSDTPELLPSNLSFLHPEVETQNFDDENRPLDLSPNGSLTRLYKAEQEAKFLEKMKELHPEFFALKPLVQIRKETKRSLQKIRTTIRKYSKDYYKKQKKYYCNQNKRKKLITTIFQCRFCKESFTNRKMRQRHLLICDKFSPIRQIKVENGMNSGLTINIQTGGSSNRDCYECLFCNHKAFSRAEDFISHYKLCRIKRRKRKFDLPLKLTTNNHVSRVNEIPDRRNTKQNISKQPPEKEEEITVISVQPRQADKDQFSVKNCLMRLLKSPQLTEVEKETLKNDNPKLLEIIDKHAKNAKKEKEKLKKDHKDVNSNIYMKCDTAYKLNFKPLEEKIKNCQREIVKVDNNRYAPNILPRPPALYYSDVHIRQSRMVHTGDTRFFPNYNEVTNYSYRMPEVRYFNTVESYPKPYSSFHYQMPKNQDSQYCINNAPTNFVHSSEMYSNVYSYSHPMY